MSRNGRGMQLAARGEPFVWLCGAGLAVAVLMIAGLLSLVTIRGIITFWPGRITRITLADGSAVLGEVVRVEQFDDPDGTGPASRLLLRTGNFDLYREDFRWISEKEIVSKSTPSGVWFIERREWGPAIGVPRSVMTDERAEEAKDTSAFHTLLSNRLGAAAQRVGRVAALEKGELGAINRSMEDSRLAVRRASIRHGEGSRQHLEAAAHSAREEAALLERHADFARQAEVIRTEDARHRVVFHDAAGRLIPERPARADAPMLASQIVRAFPSNDLGFIGRMAVFFDRWAEFLLDEPREANTEGGVFPALFGTLMMTVLMSLAVAPFGVIAALYLREYARQGPLVAAVRIAVNNLAGVPSIVFGVFGLGFFCYTIGGSIDSVFYPERLPSPTWGTGGILWASLTLALLTVPVVIVATEEALAAVPRSVREGSYGCGASKWQTIRRIVLPRATPGIMTGLILAMARGAGEVAPLMITGVVKLAPDLPIDGSFPFMHMERSFMHLGFHIFDVGFQSRNSEAAKPMVFTTTLLLIGLIALLNLAAITLRARLRRSFLSDHF